MLCFHGSAERVWTQAKDLSVTCNITLLCVYGVNEWRDRFKRRSVRDCGIKIWKILCVCACVCMWFQVCVRLTEVMMAERVLLMVRGVIFKSRTHSVWVLVCVWMLSAEIWEIRYSPSYSHNIECATWRWHNEHSLLKA